MLVDKIIRKLRTEGLRSVINFINRKVLKTKAAYFNTVKDRFIDKKGLEIGGPSKIFGKDGYIPLYPLLKQVDGCNFNNTTVWEGVIREGLTYDVGGTTTGYQYIADSIDLSKIKDETYDFILSSHSLEHIANPIKALKEWLRVLKANGALLLILPNKEFTFDNKRPITKFEHLIADYNLGTTEEDLTHLEEILTLHDLTRDELAGTKEEFKKRSLQNFNNRCLHHHVFDLELLGRVLDYLNIKVLFKEAAPPFNLIIMGIKK